MRYSLFLVAVGSLLATATPVEKRAFYTKWVTEIVTETVTAHGTKHTTPVHTTPVVPPVASTPSKAPVVASAPSPPGGAFKEHIKEQVPAVPSSTKTPQPSQPATGASGSGNQGSNAFEKTALQLHNDDRKKYSAAPLTWDTQLAQNAFENSDQNCRVGIMSHNITHDNGQNVAWTSDVKTETNAIEGAVSSWFKEYSQFTGCAGFNYMVTGHFTQMVWADTTKVGCAVVTCPRDSNDKGKGTFTTCNYDPPGNDPKKCNLNVKVKI